MANKALFATNRGPRVPKADTVNEAGGSAYDMTAEQALAQYCMTGCLSGTYYASAEQQLDKILDLVGFCDVSYLAKLAILCREKGYMKDTPALLCAILAGIDPMLLKRVFPRVIDNGRMLRNFVQIIRSGVVGRKSFGTAPKNLILNWLSSRTDDAVFRASVGQSPSLADIIKMVHPKPSTEQRRALYGYIIGKDYDAEQLPPLVQQFERFKRGRDAEQPDVPFQMLTSLDLGAVGWKEIARHAKWQMTRMNLNTFKRHGVFDDRKLTNMIADRLRDPENVRAARALPYQLLMAYKAASDVPVVVREALQDAMEIATENVPAFEGQVYVAVDVSGSMKWTPITGHRSGATSAVRAVDVAALFASCILRVNRTAVVLPFDTVVHSHDINPRDTVMTNADRLARFGGGGTDCSQPLKHMNACQDTGDLIIYVSDNQSWVCRGMMGTATQEQWSAFLHRNPTAKMVCIDVQPYGTVQVKTAPNVLNIGGFSDHVFSVIDMFSRGELSGEHWARVVKSVDL